MSARLSFLLALLLLAGAALPAQAERRVALVVGNSTYRVQPSLPNPRNDATAMARMLADELGFEVLAPAINATLPQMDQALERFAAAAEGADIALFFYAGHGLEMDGVNLLVPVEAVLAHERDAPRQTIRLEQVRKAMRGARTQVLLLDACRNNPIAGRMIRSNPPRSIVGGLVGDDAPDGVVIAYSAAPGAIASDGAGSNSPFTAALLRFLPTPGEDLGLLLRDVRRAVRQETGGQDPWLSESLSGRIYLKPAATAQQGPSSAAVMAPQGPSSAGLLPPLGPAPLPVTPPPTAPPAAAPAGTAQRPDDFFSRIFAGTTAAPPARPDPPKPDPLPPEASGGPLSPGAAPLLPRGGLAPPAQRPASPALAAGAPGRPGSRFRDCADCPEMMVIPPGRFMMGSPPGEAGRNPDEGPQQAITFAGAFALGRTHVTLGEYRAFVSATGRPTPADCSPGPEPRGVLSWRNPGFRQTDADPVVCVSRADAEAYAAWLAARTGQPYRLPSEAEWEYAARAGTTTPWWWGADAAGQCAMANGADQAGFPGDSWAARCVDGFAQTSPGGHFPANGFGLHDMAGNAFHWVADCDSETLAGTPPDGSPRRISVDCGSGILRGGSWAQPSREMRAALRASIPPEERHNDIGFRVARALR